LFIYSNFPELEVLHRVLFLSLVSKIPKILGVWGALVFFAVFLEVYPCFQAKISLTLLGFGFVSASFVGFIALFF